MAPIPITFHSAPPPSGPYHVIDVPATNGSGVTRKYWTVNTPVSAAPSPRASTPSSSSTVPPKSAKLAEPPNGVIKSTSKRRKPKWVCPPDYDPYTLIRPLPTGAHATLPTPPATANPIPTAQVNIPANPGGAGSSSAASRSISIKPIKFTPNNEAIVARCFPKRPAPPSEGSSSSTPLPSPPAAGKKAPGSASKRTPAPDHSMPMLHPYSRHTDTRNDRSINPSPKEIVRAQRMEAEKARLKEENAASARAAAAAKRKKGKASRGNSKGVTNGAATRSPTLEREDPVPTITTEPASGETSPTIPPASTVPNPLPPRTAMKRTRSTGLGISTNTANALSHGGLAVGSPLRAVTGPVHDDDDDGDEAARARKKSKLAEDAFPIANRTRRAKTTSPTTKDTARLPYIDDSAKTDPSPPRSLSPGIDDTYPNPTEYRTDPLPNNRPRDPKRKTSNASERLGLAETTPSPRQNAVRMARTVSAASSDGSGLRERTKREVTLPGRLRDYEMHGTTVV